MALKTWEMVRSLTENPNLKFKRKSDGVVTSFSTKLKNFETVGHYLVQTNGEAIQLSDEWELIQEPVTFMDAVKAYHKGKNIRCEIEINGTNHVYRYYADEESENDPYGYELQNDAAVTTREVLEGKWYIEQ